MKLSTFAIIASLVVSVVCADHIPLNVQSTKLNDNSEVKDTQRPDPTMYPNCVDIIENGNFENRLTGWASTGNVDCTVEANDGSIIIPISAINVTSKPLDGSFDMITRPFQGNFLEPVCGLSQDASYNAGSTGNIIFAQLSWVDSVITQANNFIAGEQFAAIDLHVASPYSQDGGEIEIPVYETTNDNTNSALYEIFQRKTDVTHALEGFVNNGNLAVSIDMSVKAFDGPLYYQLDNVELWVCYARKTDDPIAGGDPHFSTWDGKHFTYNGACDLTLLHSDTFADNLGMDIQVRTKHRRDFSYISNAAVRIGDEVFEVDTSKKTFYLNGVERAALPNKIAGYSIEFSQVNDHQERYTIDLKNGQHVMIKTYKDFITVKLHENGMNNFADSVGLMGDYMTGKLLGRDGVTEFQDVNAFGQEWMVLPTEPILFQSVGKANAAGVCTLPATPSEEQRRRRLGENKISEAQARKACATVPAGDRDFCVYDVVSTQDMSMVSVYSA